MARVLIGIVLSLVFLFLAGMHFYWGVGGKLGANSAVPARSDNKKIFNPGLFTCFLVGFGLLACCFLVLAHTKIISISLPYAVAKFGLSIVGAMFLLRAIGDFNYVGFFKKPRTTIFARSDTKYFSPLCLLIGLLLFTLELVK